jgi:predicted transglutaminase-like cysteine proteinase
MKLWNTIKRFWYEMPDRMPVSPDTSFIHPSIAPKYRQYLNSLPNHQGEYYSTNPPVWGKVKKPIYDVVNSINAHFLYTPDGPKDDWRIPALTRDGLLKADCDGYVAFIKEELIKHRLVSRQFLQITICQTDTSNSAIYDHMVLAIACDDCDRIVDNRTLGFILDWRTYNYKWVYRENSSGGFNLIKRHYSHE